MFKPIKEFDFISTTLIDISYEDLCIRLKDLLIISHRMTLEWISEEGVLDISYVNRNENTIIKRRIAVWSLRNNKNKSVFLSNQSDGCYTIINALKLKTDFIRIRVSKPDTGRMNEFELVKKGVSIRYVRAFYDSDRWDFYEQGERLPFENPEYYRRRKIKDRVDFEIVNEYLEACEWHLNDESFWHSDTATYFIEQHPNKKDER